MARSSSPDMELGLSNFPFFHLDESRWVSVAFKASLMTLIPHRNGSQDTCRVSILIETDDEKSPESQTTCLFTVWKRIELNLMVNRLRKMKRMLIWSEMASVGNCLARVEPHWLSHLGRNGGRVWRRTKFTVELSVSSNQVIFWPHWVDYYKNCEWIGKKMETRSRRIEDAKLVLYRRKGVPRGRSFFPLSRDFFSNRESSSSSNNNNNSSNGKDHALTCYLYTI